MTQIWAAAGAIIVSILLTMIYQNARFTGLEKRIDDLERNLNNRIDDLKDWIRSEIRRLEDRIDRAEHPIFKP